MKTNKILSAMAAATLLFAGACTDKVSYEPAAPYEGEEVYFDMGEIGQLDIETDATTVDFHLYRVDTSKEITVELESTVVNPTGEDVSAIFDVPTLATFPAGENYIAVPIGVTFEAVTPEMDYTLTVNIKGETQTPYGATVAEFTLKYGTKYAPWEEYLAGQYATFQMAGAWDYFYDAPIYFHKSTNMPHLEQYKIEDPFSDVDWDYVMTVNHQVEVEVEGLDHPVYLVNCDVINTTVEFKESELCLIDPYEVIRLFLESRGVVNPTPQRVMATMTANELPISYIDETTGTIYLSLLAQTADALGGTSWYPSLGGVQVIQLPGFKTYGVTIYEAGYNVDNTGLEEKNFALYKTEETPLMKYAMYEGTLTETEIGTKAAELLADEENKGIEENEAKVSFELAAGDYTLLLVGIDNEEVVATKAFSFSYTPTNADGFTTIGVCQYTDGFMTSLNTDLPNVTVEVEVQTNPDMPGIYRLKNAYRAWAAEQELDDMVMSGNYYLTINAEDPKFVYIEQSNLGLANDMFQGPVYAYSKAAQLLAEGKTKAQIKLRKLQGELKNNVITFPASALLVAYQNELPDYMDANTKVNFKVDLNNMEAAPIRSHRLPFSRDSRINVIDAAQEMAR